MRSDADSCSVHRLPVTGHVSGVALSCTSCISIELQAAGSHLIVIEPFVLLFGLSRLRGTSNKQKLQQTRQRVASQSPGAECGDHACGNLRSCSTGAAPESRTGRSHARATAVRILAATINKTNTTRNSPWHELWNERCSLGFRVSGFL